MVKTSPKKGKRKSKKKKERSKLEQSKDEKKKKKAAAPPRMEHFDFVKINLASPMKIRQWGERILPSGQIVGEVTKAETLNYRTLKPELDGLFCEKIFGPVKNWECSCGKYTGFYNQGVVCEECDVEITEARVRRHRMGYIDLLTPVTHIWYLKGVPSYIAHVLCKKSKEVEKLVYYNEVTDETIIGLDEYIAERKNFFSMEDLELGGAEILYQQLRTINLEEQIMDQREQVSSSNTQVRRTAIRRLRIFESFLTTNSRPEWMVLTLLPVLPPGLRPMVQLEGGRFAASDLNELYRRVVNRNNRLARLLSLYAPDIVVRSEKRMLQEAVDALIDNGKRKAKSLDLHNRPLKSLADIIKGKQGRFRQNLLGKRVDYSGRSVIVVGPHLQLNECGLPFEMATELFYPFLTHKLISTGIAGTIRMARKILDSHEPFVWPFVQSVIEKHPILLNRAPTLHRLGVQAFEPVLVRGRAIQLHPLVCPAFNADFDGDQMGVHIPLSVQAQTEARLLMLAPTNFLSPATGEPIVHPTQDMLIGCYYLTLTNHPSQQGAYHYFSHFDDVVQAYRHGQISLHAEIWVRVPDGWQVRQTPEFEPGIIFNDNSTLYRSDNLQVRIDSQGDLIVQYLRTTPGRILFNQTLNNSLLTPM